MRREPFNDNWGFATKPSIFEALSPAGPKQPVTVPHDAVLAGGRGAEGSGGSHTGYFFGGSWQYEKSFDAPAEWTDRQVTLEFEGVYRDAMVYLNGSLAGQCPNGYTRFFVDATPYLTFGGPNTVTVEARAHEDSRWYSGGGLYRPVQLLVGGVVHIAPEGPRITPSLTADDLATVDVDTDVVNSGRLTRTVAIEAQIRDGSGVVATERAPLTILPNETLPGHLRLHLERPVRWSPDDPHVYDVAVRILDGEEILDEADAHFGVRTLDLDPRKGLLVNGEVVNLRGCCIHHDNGIVGAATFEAAEERRLRILKEAGFNAIRSAHNPASRALLDACDRLGLFVMDEFSDVWGSSKSHSDYHSAFAEWWQRDVDAMVAAAYNHPSVIMYSIGNEIMEVGNPLGARQGRLIAERIRRNDPSRVVLNSINCAIAAIDQLATVFGGSSDDAGQGDGFNAAISVQDVLAQVMQLPMIGDVIEESCSYLDVVGYNYGDVRYLADHEAHPHRIIVGSETFPTQIDHLWKLVTELPYLIGDFAWVGWDYLGESGVGRVKYPGETVEFAAPYPWLTTSSGDIDITGQRRPVSYYREIVYGLRADPYLVVQDPAHAEHPAVIQAWSWNDATPSWTWDVPEGTEVVVEAYADADEVVFVLNGEEVARAVVGVEKGYVARAAVPYRPGTLVAVARRDGEQVGTCTLRTSGQNSRIEATRYLPQGRALSGDLEYVELAIVDEARTVCPNAEVPVTVTVTGPGVLQGLGTGRQSTEESFLADTCTTYQGRALAAIRPLGGSGQVAVTVAAAGLPDVALTLT